MDEITYKTQLDIKLYNHLLPNLSEIIYGAFIENKILLERILKSEIDIEDFIKRVVLTYTPEIENINLHIVNLLIKYLDLEDKHYV